MISNVCGPHRSWDVAFRADPEEVSRLRHLLRLRLDTWGHQESSEAAQLCLSELVSNVIKHVGSGTPSTLAVSLTCARLRIEVQDPDARTLPVLRATDPSSEAGRGMAMVDAVTDRWGVELCGDRKVTWCELRTVPAAPGGCSPADRTGDFPHGAHGGPPRRATAGRLGRTITEESVIDILTDCLHLLRAHGCDADDVIDRAQTRFEGTWARGDRATR